LPASYGLADIVILDGPFMSFDSLGRSGKYVLGNVVHAIHHTNDGLEPEISPALQPYLNRGVIPNPEHTKFDKFIEAGSPFIPVLAGAHHVGSMYTVRTVLPNRHDTDERPSVVMSLDDKLIKIFSGKIGNCVDSAREAAALI